MLSAVNVMGYVYNSRLEGPVSESIALVDLLLAHHSLSIKCDLKRSWHTIVAYPLVCLSVCLLIGPECIVAKWLIRFGCHLGW